MTLQESLSQELRTILGPSLRKEGFKGSGRNWRLLFGNGDCAVVNVQSSQWSTSQELTCVLNLAYVVPALVEWRAFANGRPIRSLTSASETDGIWRGRLHPGGVLEDRWWKIRSADDAHLVVLEMAELLRTRGIPTLKSFQDRSVLASTLVARKSEYFRGAGMTIWDLPLVLSDEGMSSRLDQLLSNFVEDGNPSRGVQFAQWARARAEQVDRSRTGI